jgi:acyl-homoserine lactone acylase PvdQ
MTNERRSTTRAILSGTIGAALMLAACVASAPRATLPGEGDDTGKTVLYRDTWGVPHIYAPTVAAGLYAEGWAQAEDRPRQLLLDLMMGMGEYASVVGKDGLQVDLRSRLWDHYGMAKGHWQDVRADVREQVEAFARGIDDYYTAHPQDVPDWWRGRHVDPYMVVAFTRLFIYNWSIDEVYGDLRRGGIQSNFAPAQRGSNEFAIAPRRTAAKAAILAIDPHLAWDGPSRFFAVRIHAGELQVSGVALAGAPYIGIGHSRTMAWAMTTGGPDTADVYELALDPTDRTRYRYDGEWRALTSRDVTLAVHDAEPHHETLWFSHHGPIIGWGAEGSNQAYAAKIAYADAINLVEALYEFNTGGGGYQAAVRGLATLMLLPQNIMVADTSGHIYYQRTGRVPRRPDGYDWSKPVDGSTSATEWQGLHPASDHLQVLDPPQGWMQNCNIPPDAMMPGSPFQPGTAKDYLFASREYGEKLSGWTNQRGARAVELLSADDSVTIEEAMEYVNDIAPYGADRWIEALRAADAAAGGEHASDAPYRAALEALAKWDGKLAADSRGALIYDYWRSQLLEEAGQDAAKLRELAAGVDDWYANVSGKPARPPTVSPESQRLLVGAFARATARLAAERGESGVYGDRNRVGRGERSWPLAGGGGNQLLGLTTLRNVGYGEPREDHSRWGARGQTSTHVVLLTDPPQGWQYLPWGQSDRPDSPHYRDQAEKLFSARKLAPTWWRPEDLADHIESRTVLDGAPGGAGP